MRDLLGVLPWMPWARLDATSLKRDALIFRRLVATDISKGIRELFDSGSERRKFLASNIEWLSTNGILCEKDDVYLEKFGSREPIFQDSVHVVELSKIFVAELRKLANDLEQQQVSDLKQALKRLLEVHEYGARLVSSHLSTCKNTDAYPIISRSLTLPKNVQSKKEDIFHVVLKQIPVPDDSVPWEQIMEFRNDPETGRKLLALRCWVSDVARGDLTQSEIEDRIVYLTDQYQQFMNINRMKTNVGILQTVVIGTARVAENLLKFKWSKIANSLFSIKHRRVALMEAELSAPGRALAFIAETRERFGYKDE